MTKLLLRLNDFIVKNQKTINTAGPIIIAFLLGILLPSPLFHGKGLIASITGNDNKELADTVQMKLDDGSVYDGTVVKGTDTRQGYGTMRTPQGVVYEGNWVDDQLAYGTRTTNLSVYCGEFDKMLRNDGFGIITYNDKYISSKRKSGYNDSQIIVKYIGNWKADRKEGIGRSVKVDDSMEFGTYVNGVLKAVPGSDYRVGGSVYGIDISHFQDNVDWDNLALYCDKDGNVYQGTPKSKTYMQPVLFAYMKATEGATVKDAKFATRMREAEKHEVAKGAYHFLRLGSDVNLQVKNFIETVNWTPGDMPPALDVEALDEIKSYGKEKLCSMMFEWLEQVEKKLHVRPIIYTREEIRDNYFMDDPRFSKYTCWISHYHPNGPSNKEWKIWQLTEKGYVKGINGNVDINLFKDDYKSFLKYLNGFE